MPIFLIAIGVILFITALNGTYVKFLLTLKDEIVGSSGKTSFLKWGAAIFIIAAVGYYKPVRPVVVAIIILIFAVMFLSENSAALTAVKSITSKVSTL